MVWMMSPYRWLIQTWRRRRPSGSNRRDICISWKICCIITLTLPVKRWLMVFCRRQGQSVLLSILTRAGPSYPVVTWSFTYGLSILMLWRKSAVSSSTIPCLSRIYSDNSCKPGISNVNQNATCGVYTSTLLKTKCWFAKWRLIIIGWISIRTKGLSSVYFTILQCVYIDFPNTNNHNWHCKGSDKCSQDACISRS